MNLQPIIQRNYPNRLSVVLAVLPFGAGMLLGEIYLDGLPNISRLRSLPIDMVLCFTGICAAFFLAPLVYIAIALLLRTIATPSMLIKRKWWVLISIGLVYPIIAERISKFIAVCESENPSKGVNPLSCLAIVCGLTIVMPFIIVVRQKAISRQPNRFRLARWATVIVSVLLVYWIALRSITSFQARRLERDCNMVGIWVKSNHPVPGNYRNLKLPPAFAHLAVDGLIHAVILGDGRVAMLFHTSIGWIGAWSGFVYCTAPLTPSEVGLTPASSQLEYPPIFAPIGLDDGISYYEIVNSREYLVGYAN